VNTVDRVKDDVYRGERRVRGASLGSDLRALCDLSG
jgi:hypothetical protein